MYAFTFRVIQRRCTEATQVCGLNIQKGDIIAIDVLSLHYNPEYWPGVDPNVFYPPRFQKLNLTLWFLFK